jgi:hypothetical protein
MFIDRNVTKYHTPFESVAHLELRFWRALLECAGLVAWQRFGLTFATVSWEGNASWRTSLIRS